MRNLKVKKMKKITIFDTSIASKNIGDQIIVDSVNKVVRTLFNDNSMFFTVPTHEKISRHSHRIIKESDHLLVAGTNLLSSKHNLIKANLWNVSLFDASIIKNAILMGVGWGNYQKRPNLLSILFYKLILNKKIMHSVRDSYTKNKLNSIGIYNVINTGCPTMWELTPEHCKKIPHQKAKIVICTLTDYRKDFDNDKYLLQVLIHEYDEVYFWIQGSDDLKYLESLSVKVNIIGPTLYAYDKFLSENDVDYIGTRLHAGIRAMQWGKRSIIIGVDNRAAEKEKDFNIKVLNRQNISELPMLLNSVFETKLTIDFDSIENWKNQFR